MARRPPPSLWLVRGRFQPPGAPVRTGSGPPRSGAPYRRGGRASAGWVLACPRRPSVRRLPDQLARKDICTTSFEGEDLDLAEYADLTIVTSDGVDIEPFLFAPDEGLPDLEEQPQAQLA